MQCEMREDCTHEVTHIGSKGYIYCTEHAILRRQKGHEQTRKMRIWELDFIRNGKPLPSYTPLPKPS